MDRRRDDIGPGSFGMVGRVMETALVGEMVMGTLSEGSEGDGNESYEIRSSLTTTSSISFSVDLGS